MNKHIVITGGDGYLANKVASALRQKNANVTLLSRSDLDIVTGPLPTYQALGSPDILLDFAWGSLNNYRDNNHFEVELPAHYHFLKKLVQEGLPSVMVTGTCAEYGKMSGALSEDMPTNPVLAYGFAKDALRRKLQFLQTQHKFNLIWARLFYMHGPDQPRNALFTQLKNSCLNGDAFFNMSGGQQERDYLSVEDVSENLAALALQANNIGVVNICSGEPIKIIDLVSKWLKENNWTINLRLGHYPYPDYESMSFWGDNTKLKNLLAAEPYVKK